MSIFSKNLNIHLLYVHQINIVNFLKNFSRIFFTNTLQKGLSPLFRVSKCHIWGAYGGGEGYIPQIGGYAINEGGNYKLSTIYPPPVKLLTMSLCQVDKFTKIMGDIFVYVNYYPYLCIVSG